MIKCVLLSPDKQFISQFRSFEIFHFPSPATLSFCAGSEADLISHLYSDLADVIFLELYPPFSMCFSLIVTLRQTCPDARIVVISDNKDFDIAIDAMRNGASDFLVKPLSQNCLSELMTRLKLTSSPASCLNPHLIMPIEYNQAFGYLKNTSEEFISFFEKLFIRAEMSRKIKLYEMQKGFMEFFQALVDDCEKIFPYIRKYISHKDFSWISDNEYASSDALGADLSLLAAKLLNLVRMFVSPSKNNLIKYVTNYVLENVENAISLESIAESFYVNKTYLSHLFKVQHGMSFVQFFTEVRMQRGRVLLLEDKKIYECALALNYEDTEYFSKTFKKHFGCRPSEYDVRSQSTVSFS